MERYSINRIVTLIETKDLVISNGKIFSYSIGDLIFYDKGIYLIDGDNGSGKSTLIKTICGILPPKEGYVFLDNSLIHKLPKKTIAKNISYLPQTFYSDVSILVKDFILQGLYAFDNDNEKFFDLIIEELDLESFLNRNFMELSGGEKQMCRIARSLCADVRYSFLDEPDTYLSKKNKRKFYNLIEKLAEKRGIYIVSHNEYLDINNYSVFFTFEEK